MSVWAEFNPLRSCIIGSLPTADEILPFTKLQNRYEKYFQNIIERSRTELDNLEKTLQDFGVLTYRSRQDYPIYNGKTINSPPLAIRDIYNVYGESLFKGNFAFEWNRHVPGSCDHVLDKHEFASTTVLPTDDLFFNGDYSNFNPESDLGRPLFHPPCTLRCGNDIIIAKQYGKEGNTKGKDIYVDWIKSVNPKARFHEIDTESHIDSQIFLVRPGLLLTCMGEDKLPKFFEKWDKIFVNDVKDQSLHNINTYRHKKYHPVIAESFHAFLETCTEETYFNLNSLSIDENTVLFTGTDRKLFNALEKKGVACIPVSMKATTFWDTGIHCATNEVARQGVLEDYA